MLESIDCQPVSVETESVDDAFASGRDHAVVTEVFALMYVADVYLDNGGVDRLDGVEQSYAVVSVCGSVEDYAIAIKPYLMNLVDELAFGVTLEIVYSDFREGVAQYVEVVFETFFAIYLWLTNAEKIKIRAVDNLNSHKFFVYLLLQRYK